MTTHIWLRAESKPMEERTALTPAAAKKLLEHGFKVTVEHCPQRAIDIEHYQQAGCNIVATGAWLQAPEDAIILGLKELELDSFALTHNHIHFAHVYKDQSGWQQVLNRFNQGGGTLYDLEYLVDDNGRRVAAFGYWAGFAGAAVACQAWSAQQQQTSLTALSSSPSQKQLVESVSTQLAQTIIKPKALVIGAKGRSGQGAVKFFQAAGVDVTEWDLAETQQGGPFADILNFDILINCVYVQHKIPPFITSDMLDKPRRLSVICDVSCDPYGDYNPLPIYQKCTNFATPCMRLRDGENPLDLIAIDHLPSLLPVESSEDYCNQLLPHLLTLDILEQGVWLRAKQVFKLKAELALKSLETSV